MRCFSSPAKCGAGRRATTGASARRAARTRLLTACILVPAFAGVATAQSVPARDNTSGLTVVPPAGYSASRIAPTETFTARFAVKRPSDRDTGCQVAFTPLPQNAAYTQDEINGLTASPQWLELARATITLNYDVLDTAPFAQGGIRGAVLVGDMKQRPGIPPRSQDVRTLFFILETPKGRTTTVCVGEKASFDARRTEFDAVAHGVTPPR